MESEIEVKFLGVDHDEVRAKLTELGAKLEHPMRLMRRTLFDYPDMRLQKSNHGRLRIRDEGDKLTFTYKSRLDKQYADEIETTIGSYETTSEILRAIGLEAYSSQESKRETWLYKNVEVVLDEWPWLRPYIEIEGSTEPAIQEVAKDLGFNWDDAYFGSVDTAYKVDYPGMMPGDSIGQVKEVQFGAPLPDLLKERQ
jgi:adenylate cyclase class 2